MLQTVTEGLAKFPDDALDASIDLMGLLAKQGDEEGAAMESKRALSIAERSKVSPDLTAINVLRTAAKQETLTPVEVAELRIRLRSRKQVARPGKRVA